MKKKKEKSKMLTELEQMKILGGRKEESLKLSMKNCKCVCVPQTNDDI
ncbi:hypothetical protein SAMN05216331_1566 [Porphyromonadaceae bacterium KH3R12]|nr:hypothetical protein SAMN05216331_1566 [Porphyromonadaceae bacterium KH3R12]